MISLPTLNACLNCLSATLLIAGRIAIAKKNVQLHQKLMQAAFGVSVLFLISYLIHHAQAGSTRFTGTGSVRTVYFFILTTHTILATAIVPMVLRTLFLALRKNFEAHKKWAAWTWPIWVYVSVTGVVIYAMLYHLNA